MSRASNTTADLSAQRISVAMCTYNGARYLLEQLESIAAQSQSPAELVVCDDHSSDQTTKIVQAFAARAPFPIHLHVNAERLGSTKNFEQAIGLCTGDIILLSDQDDVWHVDKIAYMTQVFSASDRIGCVITDATLVDDALRALPHRLWQSVGFRRREQRCIKEGEAFEVMLRHNVATGATMGFRSRFKSLILPIPRRWVHDGWIALLVSAVADLATLDKPLIDYRQHAANQIGAGRKKNRKPLRPFAEIYRDRIHRFALARERLLEKRADLNVPVQALFQLEQKLEHLQTRGALPRSRWRRLPIALRELLALRYHRYHKGATSFAKDLLRIVP